MLIPRWASKLPVIQGHPRLAIDNNVISDYFLRKISNLELDYIFGASNVVACCSRQVINEALNSGAMPIEAHKQVWEALQELQNKGKLFLSGITQMTPSMQGIYRQLAELLGESNLSRGKDANVFADAIVKGIPLYTTERRSIDGIKKALGKSKIADFLKKNNLPSTLATIVANSV
jgi:hypothetical protein